MGGLEKEDEEEEERKKTRRANYAESRFADLVASFTAPFLGSDLNLPFTGIFLQGSFVGWAIIDRRPTKEERKKQKLRAGEKRNQTPKCRPICNTT